MGPSAVQALIESTLAGLGYDLVDLEQSNRGRMLRVFIDHLGAQDVAEPAGAGRNDRITHDDCERASRQLQNVLAVEGIEYDRLEVSSPGLDRVLRKPADFRRFAGHRVELRLRVPREGRRKFTGLVGPADDEEFEISVDGAPLKVRWVELEKARLIPTLQRRETTASGVAKR